MDFELEERHLLVCVGNCYDVLVLRLAYFALQASPDVRIDVRRLLLVLFALQPLLNTGQVDVPHRTDALTW